MMRTIQGLLLIGGLSLSACVQYTPIELGSIPPTQEVRVSVTNEGAIRLARHLGRLTDEVSGSVAPRSSDSVAVTIWLGRDYPGTEFANVRETIVLPGYEVTGLTLRELDPWRTAFLSAGALVTTLFIANRIFQLGDPNRPPSDTTEQPPSDVTFLRIHLPWMH